MLNTFSKGKHYQAALAIAMHLFRLKDHFYMPKSELFSLLTTILKMGECVELGKGLKMINKIKNEAAEDCLGDFEQLIAIHCYEQRQFKEAFKHQREATSNYEKYNEAMVNDSKAMMAYFVKEAVQAAKESKSNAQSAA